jgi:WS/DGAT/MGAT family acyltransferase
MQQLSGLDAEFLAMESPAVYGHVGSVITLDPSTSPVPFDLHRLTDHIASRLHLVPAFRRRLVMVPLGLDQPYWVDDPDFALDYHVRELALPAPGDDEQLARQVARLHARPLDRARPLWELYLISGLSGGRAAIYTKIHHAAMDGVGSDALMSAVVDTSPEGRDLPPPPPWDPDPLPRGSKLLARTAFSVARLPGRAATLGVGLVRHAPALAAAAAERLPAPLRPVDDGLPHPALRAPATPFNADITPHRRCAFSDVPFADVKAVKRRAGVTVNDVVMALCAGALRRWLSDHDALPEAPLVAAVPVSLRVEQHRETFGNQVSAMLAALPTNIADPLERLAAASAATAAAKADHAAIPPTLLADATALAPPVLAGIGWQVAVRVGFMRRVNPWNLFISNVPGPPVPVYYGGPLVTGYYPLSAIAHGQGLNITLFSYVDKLCFGLVADRSLVPDLDRIADHLAAELDVLLAATASLPEPPPSGAPRRRAARSATPPVGADGSGTGRSGPARRVPRKRMT